MTDDRRGDERHRIDRSRAFWLRLTDRVFRHPLRFLLPIVLLAAVGVFQAQQSPETYLSEGVLSAASNPLVSDTEIRGTSLQAFESPAEGTSRIVNEQLRTAAFTISIIERAGLGEALELGLITLDTVRENVWTEPDGNSLLKVNARWADPRTSFQLVTATIDSYFEYLKETVASDGSEAEQYFTELRDEAQADLDAAQRELSTLIDGLPAIADGEDRPIEVEIQVDALTDRVTRAEEQLASAQENIDGARLAVFQSQSEAGRSLLVIDAPTQPTLPESTLRDTIKTMGMFIVLGFVLAAILLVVTTMLDQSVSTTADLASIDGLNLIAMVPPIGADHRRSRRSRSRPPNDAEPHPANAANEQRVPV